MRQSVTNLIAIVPRRQVKIEMQQDITRTGRASELVCRAGPSWPYPFDACPGWPIKLLAHEHCIPNANPCLLPQVLNNDSTNLLYFGSNVILLSYD